MEQKLIKLSDTHYIVVDDSEIKEGDFVLFTNKILQTDYFDSWFNKWEFKNYPISPVNYQKYDKPKKITHSTQPLYLNDFWAIKELKLSEVEEAIYGYSAEKMAKKTLPDDFDWQRRFDVIKGFNAHKELVKDKVFTVEDMENILIKFHEMNMAYLKGKADDNLDIKDFINTVLPKTEWECTIDEQGKLKLI